MIGIVKGGQGAGDEDKKKPDEVKKEPPVGGASPSHPQMPIPLNLQPTRQSHPQELIVAGVVKAIVSNDFFQRGEPFLISGIPKQLQLPVAEGLAVWLKSRGENVQVRDFQELVAADKHLNAETEAGRYTSKLEEPVDALTKRDTIFTGFYPKSKEHNHSTTDVLWAVRELKSEYTMSVGKPGRERGIRQVVLSENRFDHRVYSPLDVQDVGGQYPFINHFTFGEVVGDAMRTYTPETHRKG